MTQYTYFQQAAGQALPVPAVEITYGLERILAALQVLCTLSPPCMKCQRRPDTVCGLHCYATCIPVLQQLLSVS